MKNNSHSIKSCTFLICLPVYLIALGIAVIVTIVLNTLHPIFIAAAADITATIVIFIFSMVFNNSSIYDPYWSLAPLPIAFYWAFIPTSYNADIIRQVLVLLLLTIWAIRLTYNCFQRWKDTKQEDWRYADIRRKTRVLYWPVSFLGIHLFPTIIVFLGCLSLFPALTSGANPFGIMDIVAFIVTGSAIWMEAKADNELKDFLSRGNSMGTGISSGLWAYSRHPNYFGEVLFWWGLYLFAISANPVFWWFIIGPLAITLMFIFVSIPMMDRHLVQKNPEYSSHIHRVSALVPWFPCRKIIRIS